MPDDLKLQSVKDRVSAEEWAQREDLAALYRLVAMNGWDDLVFTHISARVPGPEHHFLINPYGYLFEEINASCLVKVDLDGNLVDETDSMINPAGFTIHSAIHAAREDAHVVIHLHTDQGVAVSAQKDGLLPITQSAMLVRDDLAYHDYEGVALDLDERERLVAHLGDKSTMLLRNHGTLACGPSAAEAYIRMFVLERSCKIQVMAQSGGSELIHADVALQQKVADQGRGGVDVVAKLLAWPALRRKLDREQPDYVN